MPQDIRVISPVVFEKQGDQFKCFSSLFVIFKCSRTTCLQRIQPLFEPIQQADPRLFVAILCKECVGIA